jgi:hypothetical protein
VIGVPPKWSTGTSLAGSRGTPFNATGLG